MTQGIRIGLVKTESQNGGGMNSAQFVKAEDSSGTMATDHNKESPSSCLAGIGPSSSGTGAANCGASNGLELGFGAYQPFVYQPSLHNYYLAASAAAATQSSAAAFSTNTAGWPGVQPSYQQHWQNYGPNSKKNGRQTYTRAQTSLLEQRFLQSSYVTKTQRQELRVSTGLSDRQIKIWFQNRRMKRKKEEGRRDDQSSDQNTLIPANPPTKSNLLTSGDANHSNNNLNILHQQQQQQQHQRHHSHQQHQGMSPALIQKNQVPLSTLNGLDSSDSCGLVSTATPGEMDSSSTSSVATNLANLAVGLVGGNSMMSSSAEHHLLNAHYQMQHNSATSAHLGDLIGVMENDKLKAYPPMPFGVMPSNHQSMAAMWSTMNAGGNNGEDVMASSSLPGNMTSSTNGSMSTGSSAPFSSGFSAILSEPGFAPWLPHQLQPQAMPMMAAAQQAAAANNIHINPHGHYAYNLYSANV